MKTAPTPAEAARAAERRRAIRALLARPLLVVERDGEAFAAVVRHRAELTRWFAELAGWSLVVEPGAGFARLFKRPARRDRTRPARAPGKGPFDRRRYTLFCLALAALDRAGAQTTLARLAESVRESSLDEAGLAPFDPDVAAERHAFVDVLRVLGDLGVIVFRHGDDAEAYVRSREGADALYDVRERLLGQLVAAPLPPALAGSPARMAEEERAQTEEGERLRARQTVFRMLLDDPVVYLDDLDARSREWLGHGSAYAYERLEEDVGLVVERRAEGLAGVDPDGTLSDVVFPEGSSTVKHAALLLCEWLADRARAARAAGGVRTDAGAAIGAEEPSGEAPAAPWPDVIGRVSALRADLGQAWSKEYGGPDGDARLAKDAAAMLEAFGLARRTGAGVAARPAAARFAPAAAR